MTEFHSSSDKASHRWVRIAQHAATGFRADQASIVASGVAFRATLSIFPGVAVLVWIGSQFLGGEEVQAALRSITASLPDSTRAIIGQAMTSKLVAAPAGHQVDALLGSAAPILSLLLALWSANSGVQALFLALNRIFEQTERRSFFRLLAMTLAFTIGGLFIAFLIIVLVVVAPFLQLASAIPDGWLSNLHYLRWPSLYLLAAIALGILYRYAQNREGEHASVITIGGLVAALVLLGSSAAFSWIVGRVASLPITYGSLSAIIAFMLWLWLSFAIVLAGAELDAAIERETETPAKPLCAGPVRAPSLRSKEPKAP